MHYVDQSILFSASPVRGTARFRALSGSMGALGGDVSAAVTNPAGLAVFIRPEFSLTTGVRLYHNRAGFHADQGYSNTADRANFNLNQLGLVFAVPVADNPVVSRLALGINYQLDADYSRSLYIDAPRYGSITWPAAPSQIRFDGYQKTTRGGKDEVNFMGAIDLSDRFYFGISLNAHAIRYGNTYIGYELESPSRAADSGEQLSDETTEHTEGTGFSFALGLLYKTPTNLRFGLSYITPKWYHDMREDFTDSEGAPSYFEYDLRTPDRRNASVAYVFGKSAFVDLDYYRKGYASMHLSPNNDFRDENDAITHRIRSTSNLRLGIEKRVKNASLRLGVRWEQSPYKDESDYPTVGDLWSAAAGMGYRFSPNLRLDLSGDYAYQKRDYHIFYVGSQDLVDIPDPVRLKTAQTHILLSLCYAF